MKRIFTGLGLILSIISFAQINTSIEQKIDSLKKVNLEYTSLIELNNQMIFKLNEDLFLLKNPIDTAIVKVIKAVESVFVRDEPWLLSKITSTIPVGDEIMIVGFKSEFFIIKYKERLGFVHPYNIQMDDELSKIKEYYSIKEKREDQLLQAKRMVEETKEREIHLENEKKNQTEKSKKLKEELTKKYGSIVAQKIMSGKIWIGMTSEMALDSWGEPKDINRTVTNYGTNEQWVYSDKNFLYFENGKLTAWQD